MNKLHQLLHSRSPLPRLVRMVCAVIAGFCLSAALLLYSVQDRMIYFPHNYRFQLSMLRPDEAQVLHYQSGCGKQTAFYVPPRSGAPLPKAVWVVYNGNASLALDLIDIIEQAPDPEAGFLLQDYPGYGDCEGKPSPQSILESSERAMAALAEHLKADPKMLYRRLRILGYSLGAAAGLQLAAQHEVERLVLISPFTTMMAMARRSVGWPLCQMLKHRFDNRARLAELAQRERRPEVVLFHGAEDDLIPVKMGRELAEAVPGWVQYREVAGADHITVIDIAEKQIVEALAP